MIRRSTIGLVLAFMPLAAYAQTSAQQKPTPQQKGAPTTIPGSNPPPRTITIDEAVQIGLRNSKALGIATEAVERARGRVNEQKAGFLPSATATGTLTRLDQGTSFTLNQGGQQVQVPLVKQNQKEMDFTAQLPIDIMGLIRAATQQQQFLEIAARLDYNRVRNDQVQTIKTAYYDVLRARAFVEVEEQALKNTQDRQTVAEANLRAGTGTKFEVLRAQTDVANAQQNLISAKNRVSLAIATLNNAIGLDQNTPTGVEDAKEETTSPGVFDKNVEEAYQQRPEVLEGDANIKAAEKGVKLANRSYLPTLGGGFNFRYTPDAGGFSPKTQSWAAIGTLTIPIFDQGLSRARRQQAHADVDTAKINKGNTQDLVALDVRQEYLALQEALDRLNVTTAALTQAQEQYRLAQVRFKNGVTSVPGGSPLLEISDAQAALTQAQSNQVTAQYDVQNARVRLDRAIGRYAFRGAQAPGFPAPKIPK